MSDRGEYVYGTDGNGEHWLTGERIVRCRDCVHMHHVKSWLGNYVDECWLHASTETGALGKERVEPNGFCAWGKRRDG